MNYSQIDFEGVLKHYSIKQVRKLGSELNFSCPFPEHIRGDRNPSAFINTETGLWHCFSCSRKGTIATFISQLEEVPLTVAIRWLRESYGGGNYSEDSLLPKLKEAIKTKRINAKTVLDKDLITKFDIDWKAYKEIMDTAYIFERGLSPQTLMDNHIGYDIKSKRITFPLFNEDCELIGFKGRALGNIKPKYKSIGGPEYGFDTCETRNYVWGINNAGEPKIVVEGEIDALKLRQYGCSGAIALGGTAITKEKIAMIKKKSETVILMLDPDNAGRIAEKKLAKALSPFVQTFIARLKDNDPADSTKKEIEQALNNKTGVLECQQVSIG